MPLARDQPRRARPAPPASHRIGVGFPATGRTLNIGEQKRHHTGHVPHVPPSGVLPLARWTRSRDQLTGHMPDARYLASWYFSQPGCSSQP